LDDFVKIGNLTLTNNGNLNIGNSGAAGSLQIDNGEQRNVDIQS